MSYHFDFLSVDKGVKTQLFSSFCHAFHFFDVGNEAHRFVLNPINIMIKAFEVGIPHRSSIFSMWSAKSFADSDVKHVLSYLAVGWPY